MSNQLFNAWLAETRQLQVEAYGLDYEKFEGPDGLDELVKYMKDMHIATVAEMQEMLDEISWKPWAKDDLYVNRDLVVKELVDALHFIANLLTAVGCTDEELDEAYTSKMAVNRERMLGSAPYLVHRDAGTKCDSCRRSFDDVGKLTPEDELCSICRTETDRISG